MVIVYRFIKAFWIWAIVAAVVSGGCKRNSPAASEEFAVKRTAVATVYPMASIARQVAGNRMQIVWSIDWLCENGLDPRDLQLTDEQRRATQRCDLLFTGGFPSTWAGDTWSDEQRMKQLIDPAVTEAGARYDNMHGALWLDINVMKQFAEQARQAMAVADSKHQSEYQQNAQACEKELDVLEANFKAKLGPLRGRRFLSLRKTWEPMVERFGIEEVAPIDTTPQVMTDDQVRTIKQAAKEKEIEVLAVDTALLPGVQRELQLRTGLKLMPLDLVGTSAPDGHSTYVTMMQYNLGQLIEGLK